MDFLSSATPSHPAPRADAVVSDPDNGNWRICVLSESLVRVEWSADGVFEDGPTQTVINRDFGVTPDFEVRHEAGFVVVETRTLRLSYDGRPFSREGLSCLVKTVGGNFNEWHYGDSAVHGNLGGTARTLDEVDGATDLGEGLVSKDGWAVLDDSRSGEIAQVPVVRGHDNPFGTWVRPRVHKEQDVYVFGHGHDYAGAIADLYRLTGPAPLLPRWALGNWWSRFYPYTQESYERLQRGFRQDGIPFTVSVIDMDWHKTDIDPKYGNGWTGYSWNRKLFPDPQKFLSDLHRMGLYTTLNVHPRDGIRAFEDDYPQVARDMGLDPASGTPVSFDIADPRFITAYLGLHHRLEEQGVDFWWIDWQQGGVSRQKGLDPLWMLNALHYADSGRDGRWPMTFSRYAGIGSHRYPVGFSGDTVISWDTLRFQPYFTATASNVGYGWWSNDIGGHMMGVHDEALQTRWYWLGAFSPINRLHSSATRFLDKDPRQAPRPYREAMIRALRLRHSMLPYLYTMDWRAHRDGRPLVEPMYWDNPDNFRAYSAADEYMFGSQLLVSPVVRPDDLAVHRGSADVWLPQGDWFDLFDGRRYESRGDQGHNITVWRTLDRYPVFVRCGGIVPLQDVPAGVAREAYCQADSDYDPMGADKATADKSTTQSPNSTANPHHLRLLVFPGADGRFDLVEDDGVYNADDAKMHVATTPIALDWGSRTLSISAVRGFAGAVPADRSWTVVFRGVADPFAGQPDNRLRTAAEGAAQAGQDGPAHAPSTLAAAVDGKGRRVSASYDPATLSLAVDLGHVGPGQEVRLAVPGLRVADNPVSDDAFALLRDADMPFYTKEILQKEINDNGPRAAATLGALESDPACDQVVPACHERGLLASHVPASVASALSEILLRC